MNRSETIKILMCISALYPNFKVENKEATVDAWSDMLAEYEYRDVSHALTVYSKTSKSSYAPSIAELIGIMEEPKELAYMNEGEAWSLVRKAISCSIYHSHEEFNKLPAEVQRAVGSPEQLQVWAMSEDYNESVVASNFQRAYRQAVERTKKVNNLTPEARLEYEKIHRLAIGGSVDGRPWNEA